MKLTQEMIDEIQELMNHTKSIRFKIKSIEQYLLIILPKIHFLNTPIFVKMYNDNAVQKIISSPKLFINKFLYTTTHQTHLLESHKDLRVAFDVLFHLTLH